MPRLDLFTLDIVNVAVTFMTGVALLFAAQINKRVNGIKRCSTSSFVFCAAFALYPVRFLIPGKFIILLPNVLMVGAAFLMLDGIRAFREMPRPKLFLAVTASLYLPCFLYWLYIADNLNARVAVETLSTALPTGFAGWTMVAGVSRSDRPVYWSTGSGLLLQAVSMMGRTLDALNGQPRLDVFDARTIDLINAGTVNLAAIGCVFGLTLATNLKLHRATEKLALYDSLTNLPNRRLFEDRLENAEKRSYETGQQLALIYCDLDDFKAINDTLGHEGGDLALKLVADRLRAVVSGDVCLARVGGDEFLLLVENAHSRDEMHALIDRVRTAVEGDVEILGRIATLKISCGLAIYPEDVGSASDLIRLADAAMYMMKQHGRFSTITETADV